MRARPNAALRNTLVAMALVALGVLGAPFVLADRLRPASEPTERITILHEPVPKGPVGLDGAPSSRVVVDPSDPSGLPAAIEQGGAAIAKPGDGTTADRSGGPADKTPRYAPADTRGGGEREAKVALDRHTQKEGTLHYQGVFDPEVAPFKRDESYDVVREDGQLGISTGAPRELAVLGNRAQPGRELFWGHLRVDLVPGRLTPIPSVAPDSQILGYETHPKVALAFVVDAAGNFSVRAAEQASVDLRFLMDAPSRYFGVKPESAPLRGVPQALRPRVPAAISTRVQPLLRAVGVHTGMTTDALLDALAEYFRGFEPGEPPVESGDLLADITLARKGVCRHRTHAFVVLAQALGLPAHYVRNDAHVFAEVYMPGREGSAATGWMRVDLGGGAEALSLDNVEGRHLHRPRAPDPFPKPEAYLRNYTRVVTDGPMRGAESDVRGLEAMSGEKHARGDETWADPNDVAAGPHTRRPDRPPDPPSPDEERETDPSDPRARSTIALFEADPLAFAGEVLRVRGRLTLAGETSEGKPVRLWLLPREKKAKAVLLGVLSTGRQGAFSGEVTIPVESPPGLFDLVAAWGGDARCAPAVSRE